MGEPVTDLDHARYDRDGWMESALRAQNFIVRLHAENAVLRSAVEEAIEYVEHAHIRQRLRAALAPTQAEGER